MSEAHPWTFLTNHAHVLICLYRNAEQSLREVAQSVGITERAVQNIVTDLEKSGYLIRERNGRRNSYRIKQKIHFRHHLESDFEIGDLLGIFEKE